MAHTGARNSSCRKKPSGAPGPTQKPQDSVPSCSQFQDILIEILHPLQVEFRIPGSRFLEPLHGNHMEHPAGKPHPEPLLLPFHFLDPQLEVQQLGRKRTAVFIKIPAFQGGFHAPGRTDKKPCPQFPLQDPDDPAHPLGCQEQAPGGLVDAFLFIDLLETADGPGIHDIPSFGGIVAQGEKGVNGYWMTGRHGCAGHPLRFRYRQAVHFAGSLAPYGTAMGLSRPPSCPAVACSLPACAVLFTLHSEFHTPSDTFLPVPYPFPSLPAAGSDPCCSADPPFSRRWRRDSRSL